MYARARTHMYLLIVIFLNITLENYWLKKKLGNSSSHMIITPIFKTNRFVSLS